MSVSSPDHSGPSTWTVTNYPGRKIVPLTPERVEVRALRREHRLALDGMANAEQSLAIYRAKLAAERVRVADVAADNERLRCRVEALEEELSGAKENYGTLMQECSELEIVTKQLEAELVTHKRELEATTKALLAEREKALGLLVGQQARAEDESR